MKSFIVVVVIEFLFSSCVGESRIIQLFAPNMISMLSNSFGTIDSRELLINWECVIATLERKDMKAVAKISSDDFFGKKILIYDDRENSFIDRGNGFETRLDCRGKWVIVLLMFFIYSGILFFFWDKKIQRRKRDSIEEKLVILESKYEHSQQIIEQFEENQQRKNDLQYIRECLEGCRRKFIDTFEENILNNVAQIKHGDYLPERERLVLRNTLLEDFENIKQEIKIVCSDLTEDDWVYCFLSYVGLSNHSIASCMATSCEALRKRKSRLHSKLVEEFYAVIFD